MNLIQRHADDFFQDKGRPNPHPNNCKAIIDELRSKLWDYKKNSYKIQFIERLIYQYKNSYDDHLLRCNAVVKSECPYNQVHEDILFFLQEELEDLETNLDNDDFSSLEKQNINDNYDKLFYEINLLKLGQEITYEDFKNEFEELKDYYFLNKKNWTEMFIGKLTQMVASGIIGQTISKEIINFIKDNYPKFIN